jgi:hypothetical protein
MATMRDFRARFPDPVPGELKIIESDYLTIGPFEDWSRVRSPARARRRRFRHRQNIRLYHLPNPQLMRMGDTLVGHPATVAKLRAATPTQKEGS